MAEASVGDRYTLYFSAGGAAGLTNLSQANRDQVRGQVEGAGPVSVYAIEGIGEGVNVAVYFDGPAQVPAVFPESIFLGPAVLELESYQPLEPADPGFFATFSNLVDIFLVPGIQEGDLSPTAVSAGQTVGEYVESTPAADLTKKVGESVSETADQVQQSAGELWGEVTEAFELGAFGKTVLVGVLAAALLWLFNQTLDAVGAA